MCDRLGNRCVGLFLSQRSNHMVCYQSTVQSNVQSTVQSPIKLCDWLYCIQLDFRLEIYQHMELKGIMQEIDKFSRIDALLLIHLSDNH